MNNMGKKVGIILPTYNEEQNISELLHTIHNQVPYATVIIVDDSPNDKTVTTAQDTISHLKKLTPSLDYRIIKRIGAKGRASAVREGLMLLSNEAFDYAIEMDTDGSHPPTQLPELINTAITNATDITICSRDLLESKIIGWPIRRKILHFLANTSCRLLLKVGIRDYMNAYRIYSKRAVKVILENSGQISTGFWAFGESLVHVKMRKGIVKEIPTVFVNRTKGQSNVRLKVILGCLAELVQVYFLLYRLRSKTLNF